VSSGKREVFKAVITRVLPIGLFVEVVDIQTRGIVRAGDPACGDFRFDHSRNCLVSRNGRLVIRASDIIDVIPVGIERERGTVVFKITGKPGAERPRAAPMTLEQHRRPKEGRPPRESRTPRPGRKPRKSRPPRESRNKRKGQQ
jgi:hypothetical protein